MPLPLQSTIPHNSSLSFTPPPQPQSFSLQSVPPSPRVKTSPSPLISPRSPPVLIGLPPWQQEVTLLSSDTTTSLATVRAFFPSSQPYYGGRVMKFIARLLNYHSPLLHGMSQHTRGRGEKYIRRPYSSPAARKSTSGLLKCVCVCVCVCLCPSVCLSVSPSLLLPLYIGIHIYL